MEKRNPSHTPVRRVVIFFLLAFAITWVIWVPRTINAGGFFDRGVGEVVGMVWSYGPALAAVAAALLFGGRPGLRELGARLVNWRVGWIWYAVAILGPLVLVLLAGLLNVAMGGTIGEVMSDVLDEGIVAVLLLLVVLGLTDGLGEETGWRGYALPRLLEATGAVGASLVLGVIWVLWHLPFFGQKDPPCSVPQSPSSSFVSPQHRSCSRGCSRRPRAVFSWPSSSMPH